MSKPVTPRTYRTGYDSLALTLHHDAHGWFYDGPAGAGPRHVRNSGRGPYWRGYVTPQFARVLLKRLRENGLLVGENR